MRLFKWNTYLETQISSMDTQHKKLVDLINKLGSYISKTSKDENIENNTLIKNLIEELLNYTKYHFAEEELLMTNNKIHTDHSTLHKFRHEQFITEIEDINNKKNLKYLDLIEIFNYLILWLSSHILGLDKDLALQLISIQSGTKSEDAYLSISNSKSNEEVILKDLLNMITNLLNTNRELLSKNRELEQIINQMQF